MSFIAIENAMRATHDYRQEALNKSIGACTNNHTASTYTHATANILLQGFISLLQVYVW